MTLEPSQYSENPYYDQRHYDTMRSTVNCLNITDKKIILLHVRLKGIKNKEQYSELSYEELSKLLIDVFSDLFDPKSVIVPTYTYTFTNSGVYHRLFSKSEVGRFSEEIRRNFAVYRTPDPIFSVVEISNYLSEMEEQIDYTTAFGDGCWREKLYEENCIVVNVDIDDLRYGQLHYLENLANVNYRYYKTFDGVIYRNKEDYDDISYRYFVRDLGRDPRWDRKKIEQYLIDERALQVEDTNGIKMSRISSHDLKEKIMPKLEQNSEFLLQD